MRIDDDVWDVEHRHPQTKGADTVQLITRGGLNSDLRPSLLIHLTSHTSHHSEYFDTHPFVRCYLG